MTEKNSKKNTLPESISTAATILFQLRAEKIQLLDLRGINDVVDYYLVGTCESEAQMQAILNELSKEFKARKLSNLGIEYKSGVQWAVFDAGLELMVHLFEETKREEIALDILYRDGKITMLNEKNFVSEEMKKATDSDGLI